jgi:cysteine-rich repeat protein
VCWGTFTSGQYLPGYGEQAFRKLVATAYGYCGLLPTGQVQCYSTNWQLGTRSVAGTDFIDVFAGEAYVCGLHASGVVECDGLTLAAEEADVFSAVAAGPIHACGLRKSGGVRCWGVFVYATPPVVCGDGRRDPGEACDDGNTESGDGCSATCQSTEVCGNGIVELSEACDDHGTAWGDWCDDTCALTACDLSATSSHTVEELCSTGNPCAEAQCDLVAGCYSTPAHEGAYCDTGNNQPGVCRAGACVTAQLSSGDDSTCYLDDTGHVTCWGNAEDGLAAVPAGIHTEVAVGRDAACALRAFDGDVRCWGANENITQGTGLALPSRQRYRAGSLAVGANHACLVTDDGAVSCWGDNEFGQLDVPAEAIGVIAIAASDDATCAVTNGGGSVSCWGSGASGQTMPPPSWVKQIAAFGETFCATDGGGYVYCWGDNEFGQAEPPGPNSQQGYWARVTVGRDFACGVLTSGRPVCWGSGAARVMPPASPQNKFQGQTQDATQWVAGAAHTCGVRSSGGVACFGENDQGQASPPGECGDGVVDPAEACDDGELSDGDGCSADCRSRETCGNGIVDENGAFAEVCDDGGDFVDDTCSSTCEVDWQASTISVSPEYYFSFEYDSQAYNPSSGFAFANLGTATPQWLQHWSGNGYRGSGIVGDGFYGPYDFDPGLVLGPPAAEVAESFTASLWMYQFPGGSDGNAQLMARVSPTLGELGWLLMADRSNEGRMTVVVGDGTGATNFLSEQTAVTFHEFHHVALTLDAPSRTLTLYVDGAPAAATTLTLEQLGARSDAQYQMANGFYGYVDEVAIWNTALAPSQIESIYRTASEGRALGRQLPSNTYASPCAALLRQNPQATDGIYQFPMDGVGTLVPMYCDMTGGGYTLVLKKSSGVAMHPMSLWYSPQNDTREDLLGLEQATEDYSSRLIGQRARFREARVDLLVDGQRVHTAAFDTWMPPWGNAVEWFAPGRLLSSTWSDLPAPAQRYWHGSGNGRYFTYYNGSDGSTLQAGSGFLGCQDPSIWLWVGTGGGPCSYHVDNYDVRYSAGPSTSLLSESATADALLIFVR